MKPLNELLEIIAKECPEIGLEEIAGAGNGWYIQCNGAITSVRGITHLLLNTEFGTALAIHRMLQEIENRTNPRTGKPYWYSENREGITVWPSKDSHTSDYLCSSRVVAVPERLRRVALALVAVLEHEGENE